jgi:hypothetical protein
MDGKIEMVLLVLMKVIPSKKMTIGTDTGNLPASDVRAFSQIIETNYG